VEQQQLSVNPNTCVDESTVVCIIQKFNLQATTDDVPNGLQRTWLQACNIGCKVDNSKAQQGPEQYNFQKIKAWVYITLNKNGLLKV